MQNWLAKLGPKVVFFPECPNPELLIRDPSVPVLAILGNPRGRRTPVLAWKGLFVIIKVTYVKKMWKHKMTSKRPQTSQVTGHRMIANTSKWNMSVYQSRIVISLHQIKLFSSIQRFSPNIFGSGKSNIPRLFMIMHSHTYLVSNHPKPWAILPDPQQA